ncbi:MAG: esterase/lipase family protein [Massilia sp.]
MSEPTRPIRQPTIDADGSLVAHTVATPKAFKVRALVTVAPRKVIPVILVPGIMGSNLRVRRDAAKGTSKPGEPVWRPPNGSAQGLREAWVWSKRDPAQRQTILDPELLEVDDSGELDGENCSLGPDVLRERGWGEVHADSYATLLVELQSHLDMTFRVNALGSREVREHWRRVMSCSPASWGVRTISPITEPELERYAAFQYPVYAVGYNWLQSCAVSAQRLSQRIDEIRNYWISRKHECEQVILITHSMGGLVARACAKLRSSGPGDNGGIAGVIHGVMPALGAPVAYRRIACGTEGARYENGLLDNVRADKFAEIAGETTAKTTPVMAVSPGVLELLPNHLYPRPWLIVRTGSTVNKEEKYRDVLSFPIGNPYDFYRDVTSWYRMVDPALADPARRYHRSSNGVAALIGRAIDAAEHLHTKVLAVAKDTTVPPAPYYHPHTYAFYCSDEEHKAFGQIQWVAHEPAGHDTALTQSNLKQAQIIDSASDGTREVMVENRLRLRFHPGPQDTAGDDTIPGQSGAGPAEHVGQLFRTRGYGHQDSFQDKAVLLLTQHLIVKIVQACK